MEFPAFDAGRVAGVLAQLRGARESVEAFFERLEVVAAAPEGESPRLRHKREEGFSLRLLRDGTSWGSSRDGIDREGFLSACRQVARALPTRPLVFGDLEAGQWPDIDADLVERVLGFSSRVANELRARNVAFPLRIGVKQLSRQIRVVGAQVVPAAEKEVFFSVEAELLAGRWGTLLTELEGSEQLVARSLASRFRARDASPPPPGRRSVVLGPGATAVFLHEAVAHTLEADTLALTGRPSAAIGVQLGAECLDLIEDPSGAPTPVRRVTDDEGLPAGRRWLLRSGRVEQPLADRFWSDRDPRLVPGASRRSDRHTLPGPRTYHLELLPGTTNSADLVAEIRDGVFVEEISRGRLDPYRGEIELEVDWARRIRGGQPAERLGPFCLGGRIADILRAVSAVGNRPQAGGAGWCAKGGRRLPVWSTTPAIRIDDIEVRSR